ncbi:MAG: nucleotidyltransferase [Bacteroidales bacterium]|nr:MAG: nucleotidyltransferase [Bacteroidales bacterium]
MNRALINRLTNYFANQPIERAWIFGSYARSEENSQSDIDILVNFSPEAKITLFKYIHIVNELERLTGKKVDLVEDGQLKQFAIKSSENERILIYERKAQG